jgi:hypothetical protein
MKSHKHTISPHLPFPRALLLPLFSLLLLASCNLFNSNTSTYDITLEPGQSYDINLGQSGDEEASIMSIQPLHASVSETYRDTINWDVHYHYVPYSSYVGTDYVKFELASYYQENPWNSYMEVTTEGYVEINFTIENIWRTGQ